MALEDLTGDKYVDDLVEANPPQADFRYEGAGHLRGIKNVLKKAFAFITGPVTATHLDLNKTKDFPTITAGDALKGLRVNAGETAYEFVADIGASTANITEYTASAGQTTFSGTDDHAVTLEYSPGYLMVYLNGILLEDTTDYTATNGTSIVLTTGAAVGDVLQAFGFGTFDLADHYTKTQVDANKYDKTEVDALLQAIPGQNMIMNAEGNLHQRNGAITGVSTLDYISDRWRVYKSGAGVWNTGFGANGSVADGVLYHQYLTVTTADTSIAAGEYVAFQQMIEGHVIRNAKYGTASAEDLTLSFWHAHTKTGTHSVTFRDITAARYYTAEYTQAVTGTWEKAVITIPGDTTGTWETDASGSFGVMFVLTAGSTYATAASSAWAAGNKFGSTSAVNNADAISNIFRITNAKLELGDKETPYVPRTREEDLAQCQRYYEKSFTLSSYPGESTSYVGARRMHMVGLPDGSNGLLDDDECFALACDFNVHKRVTPTITWYAPDTGTVDKIYDITNSSNRTIGTVQKPNVSTTGWPRMSVARKPGTEMAGHWTADAEIS